VLWNIEQGLASLPKIARAETLRTELFTERRFLERYDFLLCPVNQLPPYPVTEEWPRAIAGVAMENYLDWMKSCYYITITSHPAISVPAGFTSDDPALPVGLQIVGRYRDDLGVLQLATPSKTPPMLEAPPGGAAESVLAVKGPLTGAKRRSRRCPRLTCNPCGKKDQSSLRLRGHRRVVPVATVVLAAAWPRRIAPKVT
jgi:hypothetical protein